MDLDIKLIIICLIGIVCFVVFVIDDNIKYEHNLAQNIISKINCETLHKNGNQIFYEVFYLQDKDVFFKRSYEVYNHIEKLDNSCGLKP